MCRLLAYVAPSAVTTDEVVGEELRREWQRMGRLHADGWGTSWINEHGALERERAVEPGTEDARFTEILAKKHASARIAHLRFATGGCAVTLQNAHPFVTEHFSLAHNGSIRPLEQFLTEVSAEELAPHGGDSDTAVLVALIERRVREGASVYDAVKHTVEYLAAEYPTSSVNLLVLSEDELIVVHSNDGNFVPPADFDEVDLTPEEWPPNHHDVSYLQLYYKRFADGAIAVSSTGIALDGWLPLEQRAIARIPLDTRTVELEKILVAPADQASAVA